MNSKTTKLNAKEIRQINYTLIEMLWELCCTPLSLTFN